MRLAIVAAPPLALVSIATLVLGLAPHLPSAPPPDRDADKSPPQGCSVRAPEVAPEPTCATAHALFVHGHVAGGASHVQLAGPVLYTDVATDRSGDFTLRVPVDGNVCDLLAQPTSYIFGEDVSYTISFE